MSFPVTDWQFWLVTAVAGFGLWNLIKTFLPRSSTSEGCSSCETCGPAAAAPTGPELVSLGGSQGRSRDRITKE